MKGDPKNFLPDGGKVPERREIKDLTERLGLIIKTVSGKPDIRVTTEVDFGTLMEYAREGKDARKMWFRQADYDPRTRKRIGEHVHIPEQIFEENENSAKGKAAHEAGHVAITRGVEFIPDKVMQELGFKALRGGIEERPTDQVVRERYPGAGEWVDEARFLGAQSAIEYAIEYAKEGGLGSVPKFAQFSDLCVYAPQYGDNFPEYYDADVVATYKELKSAIETIEHTLPSEGAGEDEIIEAAKERYKITYSRVWPEVQKFVVEDKRDRELEELLRELLQGDPPAGGDGGAGEGEDNPPAGGRGGDGGKGQSKEETERRAEHKKKLKEFLDQLPPDIREQLERLKERLRAQQKSKPQKGEQKGNIQSDKSGGEGGGEVEGEEEHDDGEAGASGSDGGGVGEEEGGEEGKEGEGEAGGGSGSPTGAEKGGKQSGTPTGKLDKGSRTEGGSGAEGGESDAESVEGSLASTEPTVEDEDELEPGEPASLNQGEPSLKDLDAAEREKLEELFNALPEETKEFLRYAAKKALEELEDKLAKLWSGKLDESPVETHEEFEERKKKEDKDKEKEAKRREGRKDVKKELEEIERRQAELGSGRSEYDKGYDSVREFDERLYRRLEEVFTPNVKRATRLRDTGSKLNLPAVFRWKSSRAAGASSIENKIFESTHLPEKQDYVFTILNDLSGSMMGGGKIQQDFRAKILLTEVLNRLGIKLELLGFHDTLISFKGFDEDLSDAVRNKVSNMLRIHRMNFTNTGEALAGASKNLERTAGKEKFLLVLTDGMPASHHKSDKQMAEEAHAAVADVLRNTDQKLIGVGIGPGTEFVKMFFPTSLNVGVEELVEVLGNLLEDMIMNPDKYRYGKN